MPLFKSLLMSGKHRHYDPMSEDGSDGKTPIYNDQAFEHGIHFHVKFIGSQEVPKPTSRAEIVAGMRRIRYDFKARAVKKRQVNLSISMDGIQASLRDKNNSKTVLLQYPIYRVFYVSHDSLDLKIFSFIVRDYDNNSFRCYVFKEYQKNEAMRIVRTIGQAFDVCHKISLQNTESKPEEPTPVPVEHGSEPPSPSEDSVKHQTQFLQEQIQHLQQQTELTVDQLKLVTEQLNIETNARIEAQKKNNELLDRNRELLTHIQQLLIYSQQLELNLSQQKETSKNVPTRPTDLLLLPLSVDSTLSSDSPDSGKGNEISSESISDPFLANQSISISTDLNPDGHWSSSSCSSLITSTFPRNPFQTEFDALVQ